MTPFNVNLRKIRRAKGMTQDDLAQRLHVTRQTVSGWETGRCQPDIDTLTALAQALEADIHELLYGVRPGEYPRFQRRFVIWTGICGGIVTVLALFRLLLWPYLKKVCATYHWAPPMVFNHYYLPTILGFAAGALIPAMLSLTTAVRVKNEKGIGFLVLGAVLLLPTFLLWTGIWTHFWLYPIPRAIFCDILPFLSGALIFLGVNRE